MLGPIHTQDWEPTTIALQALSLVEKAELVQVCFTLHLKDQWSLWMQDGCKVYMDSNGSCFMVSWTIFKNHLLEEGLPQNRETMELWTLTTVGLVYFIMCEDPHEYKFVEIAFSWGPTHIWLHITWFWRCVGTVFGHFLLGSHNYMVTTLGSCVKWPLGWKYHTT